MKRKIKEVEIRKAIDALNKALEIEEPHIRIKLGFLEKNEFTQPLLDAIKVLIAEYKRVYGLEKVAVDLVF
jgi:hypothetical protein